MYQSRQEQLILSTNKSSHMIKNQITTAIQSSSSHKIKFDIIGYIAHTVPETARYSPNWHKIIQKSLKLKEIFMKLPQTGTLEPKRFDKPPYSYVVLCQMAIMSSPHQMMTEAEIIEFLISNFPCFVNCPFNWRELVKENLIHHDCFTISHQVVEKGYRFNYWKMSYFDSTKNSGPKTLAIFL